MGQAVEAYDPLLDIMRPLRERTPGGDYLLRQQLGGPFIGRCVQFYTLKDEVPKEEFFFLLNAPRCRIKENLIRCPEIVREKFAKPFFTDTRDLREQNDQFVIPALDFTNLTGNEQRTLLDDTFSSQHAMSAVDQIATERPGIDTLG